MNPARLAELQRQRALVHEQLAWLDREIAAATSETLPPTPLVGVPKPAFAVTALDEAYRPDPVTSAAQMRRGCLLLATAILLAGALALTAIYFLRYRDHPLFGSSPAQALAPSK